MSKIEIFNEADRLAVASVLVKNGYTVRQTREKVGGRKAYVYFLEYTRPGNTERKGEGA